MSKRAEEEKKRLPRILKILSIPEWGYMDKDAVLSVFPISARRWEDGVKTGEFPAPFKLTERRLAWMVKDIKALCESRIQAELVSELEGRV